FPTQTFSVSLLGVISQRAPQDPTSVQSSSTGRTRAREVRSKTAQSIEVDGQRAKGSGASLRKSRSRVASLTACSQHTRMSGSNRLSSAQMAAAEKRNRPAFQK